MSRPLHHRPAPTPAYLRIATHLEREMAQGHMPVHTKLPAERALAETFAVNRQTVRAALQWLRQRGLVVTDRRGTYVNGAVPPSVPPSVPPASAPGGDRHAWAGQEQATRAFPVDAADGSNEGRLYSAPVSPSLADALGILRTRPALTYHQRFVNASGELTREALTHFAPTATLEIPELSRYVPRLPVIDPDLRLLHHWLTRSGIRPAVKETVTVTRCDPQIRTPAPPELAIRRHLYDQHGRLLAITDVTFPGAWQEISLTHAGPFVSTHDMRPASRTHADGRVGVDLDGEIKLHHGHDADCGRPGGMPT